MFDQLTAAASVARIPGERVRAYAVVENAACAARLSAMADMLAAAQACDGSADREQWRLDNWGAVCAQIGAAHEVTSGVVSGLLMDAVALRERLPKVAAVFAAGRISYRLVHAICTRTALVQDRAALKAVDAELAAQLCGRGAMSVDQAHRDIDALVLRHDPYALRRTQNKVRGQYAQLHVDDASGTAELTATLSVTDGKAVDQRADALARTVCEGDPRTLDQRRAAALGAMGFGWDRLPCLCERADCAAAATPPVGGIVIHVITRADTLDTRPSIDEPHPDDPGPDEPVPDPGPETQSESESESESESVSDAEPESAPAALVGDVAAQRRSLVGPQPALLPRPWYTYTWSGLNAALDDDPGEHCDAGPAVILGGAVLPAPVAAHAAGHATIRELRHPGQAPPEPRHRPSKALAEFVRCRDLTCRFPGCTKPATVTDLDHTIAYPYGPTCASNLKCLCREHHLLKTFWPGWSDRQLPDGTVIWTDPDGHTSTTYPASRLLFPELSRPTAHVVTTGTPPTKDTAGLAMPRRTTTRDKARRQRIDDERQRNTAAAEQYLRESVPPI